MQGFPTSALLLLVALLAQETQHAGLPSFMKPIPVISPEVGFLVHNKVLHMRSSKELSNKLQNNSLLIFFTKGIEPEELEELETAASVLAQTQPDLVVAVHNFYDEMEPQPMPVNNVFHIITYPTLRFYSKEAPIFFATHTGPIEADAIVKFAQNNAKRTENILTNAATKFATRPMVEAMISGPSNTSELIMFSDHTCHFCQGLARDFEELCTKYRTNDDLGIYMFDVLSQDYDYRVRDRMDFMYMPGWLLFPADDKKSPIRLPNDPTVAERLGDFMNRYTVLPRRFSGGLEPWVGRDEILDSYVEGFFTKSETEQLALLDAIAAELEKPRPLSSFTFNPAAYTPDPELEQLASTKLFVKGKGSAALLKSSRRYYHSLARKTMEGGREALEDERDKLVRLLHTTEEATEMRDILEIRFNILTAFRA